MKKLIALVLAIFLSVGIMAQTTVLTPDSQTINGNVAVNFVVGPYGGSVDGWSYSIQLLPVQVSGDSLNTAVAVYQSNALDGDYWTQLTAKTDTITSTSGLILSGTDFTGERLKVVLTGISSDSLSYAPLVIIRY